jgi:uncharacterized coiled-coil DUF342 family protein
VGFDKFNELESKLKETLRRYDELQTEAAALHKIQNQQSKALDNLEVNKNYPGKIRELVDESRELRDKNKALEDRLRYYEEQKKNTYNEMVALEDR